MSKQFKVICNVSKEEFGPYSADSEAQAFEMAAVDAKLGEGQVFSNATTVRVDAEGVAELSKWAAENCDFE